MATRRRHRRGRQAPRGRALPDRQGPLHRRHQPARAGARALPALGRGARADPQDRHRGGARRCRACSRSSPARTSPRRRRHALRLAGHRPDGSADEGAEAPGAGRGQGAPRRRPGRRGGRRDAGRRRATRPRRSSVDIEALPAVVDMRAALEPRRAAGARRARRQPLLRLGLHRGQPRRGRRGVRGGAARRRRSSSSTTGWCRTRWSRAPPSASTTRPTSSTRSTPPARTRT